MRTQAISIRGFHITEGQPGHFLQCNAHRYPSVGNVDVPLVDTVFGRTRGMQIRRLWARNPEVSRVYYKYLVYFVARQSGVDHAGARIWAGEMMVFRGAVRGEGLVNMRGRDDLMARRVALR